MSAHSIQGSVDYSMRCHIQARLDVLWSYVEKRGPDNLSQKTLKELERLQAIEDRYLEDERKKYVQPEVN